MAADERWAPCPGVEGRYRVSDMGRVLSVGRFEGGRWLDARVLRPGPDNDGYARVSLMLGGGRKRTALVHRLVALAFVGNPDPARRTEVDHLNGDHMDARAANLEWVEPDENKRRAHEKGLTSRRLSEAQVARIRDAAAAGRGPRDAARAAGCSVDAARNVMRGRTHAGGRDG